MSLSRLAEPQANCVAHRIAVAIRCASQVESALSLPAGLCREMVADVLGADEGGPGRSGINHNEVPIQIVLSLGADRVRPRLLLDPAVGAPSAQQRYLGARGAINRSFRQSDQASFLTHLEGLFESIGPDSTTPVEEFSYGVAWLAASVGGKGRAVYIDTSARDPVESWERVVRVLEGTLGLDCQFVASIKTLATMATPVSFGLEAEYPHCRLKLHTRLTSTPGSGALAAIAPMLTETDVHAALAALMIGGDSLSLHGCVLEVASMLGCGRLSDAKLDLAMPELWPADVGYDKAQLAANAMSVCWPGKAIELLRQCCRLSYVGLGKSAEGKARLNLYFKPSLGQ